MWKHFAEFEKLMKTELFFGILCNFQNSGTSEDSLSKLTSRLSPRFKGFIPAVALLPRTSCELLHAWLKTMCAQLNSAHTYPSFCLCLCLCLSCLSCLSVSLSLSLYTYTYIRIYIYIYIFVHAYMHTYTRIDTLFQSASTYAQEHVPLLVHTA